MAHTFANLLFHVIFGTKDRQQLLDPELKLRLFPYMAGILRQLDCRPDVIGGPGDHVHLLVALPPPIALADAVRILKTNSSRWVHEQWPQRHDFAWQTGYGAFSVSQSNVKQLRSYIQAQEEHHQTVSFQEEFKAFLRRHSIAFDLRYLWE